MRMLAFSHWGAQKSHRGTPDTLDTRIDALIMDRCRSEQGQIRSPKHRTSAISMTYAAMPADESRWRYHCRSPKIDRIVFRAARHTQPVNQVRRSAVHRI